MEYILKNFLPRLVQDGVTAGVGILAAHGYVTADQTQSLVGSLFFIAMLVANRLIGDAQRNSAAIAGGLAVAAVADNVTASKPVVQQIIEESKS